MRDKKNLYYKIIHYKINQGGVRICEKIYKNIIQIIQMLFTYVNYICNIGYTDQSFVIYFKMRQYLIIFVPD